MEVNIHEAKTQLSCLIERVLKGEEVTIAKAGGHLVRLIPIQAEKPVSGSERGLVTMAPGWLLLDTHAFLFAIAEPELLTAKSRRLLAGVEVERWVSVVSLQALKAQTLVVSLQQLPLHRTLPAHKRRSESTSGGVLKSRYGLLSLQATESHQVVTVSWN